MLMDLLSAEAVCVLGCVTFPHSIVPLHDGGGNWYHQTQTNLMSPASFPLPVFRLGVKSRYTLLVSVEQYSQMKQGMGKGSRFCGCLWKKQEGNLSEGGGHFPIDSSEAIGTMLGLATTGV